MAVRSPSPSSAKRRMRRGSPRSLAFETLDARDLLATVSLLVEGQAPQTFATIQAAVNSARPGNIIELSGTGPATGPAGNGFKESVNLSLMGSAVGSSPGSLTIRGIDSTTETTTISALGGSAFYNSQAFTGNLTLENLTLYAATATAGRDAGLSLNNYAGSLTVRHVNVMDGADAGIEVTNSSGNLLIDDVEISSSTISSPIGLRMVNYAASGNIRASTITDMSDAAVVIDVSGTTQMNVMLIDFNALLSSGSDFTANDGIRATTSSNAVLDLGITSSDFDDIPANSLDVSVDGASKANVTVFDSHVTMSEGATRVVTEPAVRFSTRSSSQLSLFFERNVLTTVTGDNFLLQALGTSTVQASISDTWFLTPGTAAGHRAIVIQSDASSTSTVNAKVSQNLMFSPFGDGISLIAAGSSTFNVIMEDNTISYTAGDATTPQFGNGVSGIRLETAINSNAQLNTRILNNTIDTPTQPGTSTPASVRFLRQSSGGTSRIRVEAATTPITSYLPGVNFGFAAPTTSAGSSANILPLAVGALDVNLPLTIGDSVWDDTNKDARHQVTETGTSLTLLTLTGTETVGGATVTRKTWTAGDGTYVFGGLKPGTYTVTVTPRAGMDLTGYTTNRDINDVTIDSNFRQGVRTASVTLVTAVSNTDLDAGLIPTDGKLWKNQALAEDVDDDGVITPLDALLIIIDLNAVGPRATMPVPSGGFAPQPFLDVDGDNSTTPLDALLVIIKLNTGGGGEGQGEPEPLNEPLTIAPLSIASPKSTSDSTAAPWDYLPPEYFTSFATGSQSSSDSDSDASALDAFFAELAD